MVNLLWSCWYLTSRVTHSLSIPSYIICIHNFVFFFLERTLQILYAWQKPGSTRELNILLQKIRLTLIKQVGNHLRWCKNEAPTCSVEVQRNKSHLFCFLCGNLVCPCMYKLQHECCFLPFPTQILWPDVNLCFILTKMQILWNIGFLNWLLGVLMTVTGR